MKVLNWKNALALVAVSVIISYAMAREESDSKADELLIAAQKICPVTGEELGSHGQPIKAMSGEQAVFLCCDACEGQEISKENWEKVIANLIHAQGRCPVMNRPLPENPAFVVVNHRMVFVCCKPCTRKIQSNPEKYLATVDKLLEKNLAEEAQRSSSNSGLRR